MNLSCPRYLYFIVFILFSKGAISQTIELTGYIKDAVNGPLPYANIIAKPKDATKTLKYTITDDEGFYRLVFQKNDTLNITASYLGFESISFDFIATKNTSKTFLLKQSSNQLNEVVIELPVTVKGDTTIYRTDTFITGEERKLKNVLKKLPGVEVSKNGNVTVQGKKVTKMLVDGKKFFGGNSKLAVDHIPANAVDKVQVIDNYNEVAFLKNLSDSDELAMNIELKEDKKRFVFGDVEMSKGNDEFYKTHANLFYYSPITKVNFIGNLNNIAEKTFTFKDYLNFQGDVNAIFSGNFNFRGGDFSQFLENRDVLQSKQRFGALNITKTTSRKLDVSGYLIFSQSDENNFFETQNDYSSFNEFRKNKTELNNLSGIGKLNIAYKSSDNEQWHIRSQFKKTNNDKFNSITSLINTDLDSINTERGVGAISLTQNIEWHKKQSEKHTFSALINYEFRNNNQNTFWQTEDDILQGLIPITPNQNLLRLQQAKDVEAHVLEGVFKHFWEINNRNHIYTMLGNNYLKENFITNDSQELDNGSVNTFTTDDFGNHMNFMLNDFYLGVHYKFGVGIFTVKQGISFHNYSWRVHQQNKLSQNKWVVLPDFLAKIAFTKSKKLELNYGLKTSFSDASKFASRFYLQSYNSVFRGNEALENNLFHAARIYYSKFSLYRGLMINGSFSYRKQIKGVRNSVVFDGVNQFLTNRIFNNPSETMNSRLAVYKKIKKIRYKFHLTGSRSKYIQEIDNSIKNNSSTNYSYKIGLETLYDDFPKMEFGFKRSIGNFTSSNSTSKFVTNEPFLTIDYDFLKGFIVSFDYVSYDYRNTALDQKNRFDVANFSLSYRKENNAWTYKVFSNNLFNTEFKRNSTFSQYLIADTKTYILPRVLMLSVSYNL